MLKSRTKEVLKVLSRFFGKKGFTRSEYSKGTLLVYLNPTHFSFKYKGRLYSLSIHEARGFINVSIAFIRNGRGAHASITISQACKGKNKDQATCIDYGVVRDTYRLSREDFNREVGDILATSRLFKDVNKILMSLTKVLAPKSVPNFTVPYRRVSSV